MPGIGVDPVVVPRGNGEPPDPLCASLTPVTGWCKGANGRDASLPSLALKGSMRATALSPMFSGELTPGRGTISEQSADLQKQRPCVSRQIVSRENCPPVTRLPGTVPASRFCRCRLTGNYQTGAPKAVREWYGHPLALSFILDALPRRTAGAGKHPRLHPGHRQPGNKSSHTPAETR